MTDISIIELYFKRSEQAIKESQVSYGGYCYCVANGILNDPADSEENLISPLSQSRTHRRRADNPQALWRELSALSIS